MIVPNNKKIQFTKKVNTKQINKNRKYLPTPSKNVCDPTPYQPRCARGVNVDFRG